MKKKLVILLLCMPVLSFAQDHQLGLRLGEPFGITYKTYIDDRFSFEGLIGSAGANSSQYYRRYFQNNKPNPTAIYGSHSSSNSFSLNARVAYNEDITAEFDISEGSLNAYAGLGLQFRSVRVNYIYFDGLSSSTLFPLNEYKTNIDVGPEAFIGSEYFFEGLPLAVFAEIGLFLELVDRPGNFRLQGGIGARYLFNQ